MKKTKDISDVVIPAEAWEYDTTRLKEGFRSLFQAKLAEIGLSKTSVERMLHIERRSLDSILDMNPDSRIDFINVIKVSDFLGVPIEDMARSYTDFLSAKQISDIQRAREAGFVVSYFDVKSLMNAGFIKSREESEVSKRIVRYFGLPNIYEYSNILTAVFPAFSKTKRNSDDKMRHFWVISAYSKFEKLINPNDYNRSSLKNIVPKLRSLTQDVEKGLYKAVKALFSVGVTVIFQESLPKAQVRGATMCVNGKPCIVLSNLNKHYHTLWFALMHELYHVLFDFEEIREMTYHLSGCEDLFLLDESRADNFASQYLLEDSRRKFAYQYISSGPLISKLASKWSIHPSIIYAAYAHDKDNGTFYNKSDPGSEPAIKLLNTHTFEKETILESVNELKKLFNIN